MNIPGKWNGDLVRVTVEAIDRRTGRAIGDGATLVGFPIEDRGKIRGFAVPHHHRDPVGDPVWDLVGAPPEACVSCGEPIFFGFAHACKEPDRA